MSDAPVQMPYHEGDHVFYKEEDIVVAKLKGASAMSKLLLDGKAMIDQIVWENEAIIETFIPTGDCAWEYKIGYEWVCDQSPMGLCLYHKFEDPASDNCIFCHEPLERK